MADKNVCIKLKKNPQKCKTAIHLRIYFRARLSVDYYAEELSVVTTEASSPSPPLPPVATTIYSRPTATEATTAVVPLPASERGSTSGVFSPTTVLQVQQSPPQPQVVIQAQQQPKAGGSLGDSSPLFFY